MYGKESSGTQIQSQIILKLGYIPHYLSVSYDYSSKYKRRLLQIIYFIFASYHSLDVCTGPHPLCEIVNNSCCRIVIIKSGEQTNI